MRLLFYHSGHRWSGSARAFADAGEGLIARGHQVTYVCPANSPVAIHASRQGCEVVPLDPDTPWWLSAWQLHHLLTGRLTETVFVHTERERRIASLAVRIAGRGSVIRRTSASTDMPLGIDVERYKTIAPTSTDEWPSPPPANAQLVVCVYDPSGRQSSAHMLRTVALLRPRHPELHLVIVGPGSQHEDLRMHAAALDLTHHVSFLGDRGDQREILRTGILGWVVASGDDGAYGVLDFMAMGTPVLIERGAVGQQYMADGITGESLAPDDAPAAAATIAPLLTDATRRTAMGNAGRVRVARDFSAHAMVDAMERAAEGARDRPRWTT